MFDFAARFNQLDLCDAEIALLSAIALMATDRPGLRSVELITRIQDAMKRCLQRLISANHPDQPDFYNLLMRRIPDLRTLNTLHSEKLLGSKMEYNLGRKSWLLPRTSSSSTTTTTVEADSPNSSFGRCGSSSPQSCSPTSVTSSEMTRAADSGVESGSDTKFEVDSESERRRMLDSAGLKTLTTSQSQSQPQQQPPSDCDMPVLKRALQAPPLTNASEIYAELYRTHKKFRAARRPEETRVDSTTTPKTQTPEPKEETTTTTNNHKKEELLPSQNLGVNAFQPMFRNTHFPTHFVPTFDNYYGNPGMMPASVAAVAGSAFGGTTAAAKTPFPHHFMTPFYPQPDFRLMHQQMGSISLYPQAFEMPMGYFPMMQARMAAMAFPPPMSFDSSKLAPARSSSPIITQKRSASSMSNDGDEPLNLSKTCKLDN